MRNRFSLGTSLALTFALAGLASAACVTKTAAPPPAAQAPAAGGTGAFGIVTVDGHQKLYLPLATPSAAGHAQIAVLDVGVAGHGVAGAPALMKLIDLGTAEQATTTGGDATVIVAASTDNDKVWFIDPVADAVVSSLALDASFGRSDFSGGGGFVTGIAMDSANHRAILSTWNGFTLLDTSARAITRTIQAPPSENFGFDSIHQRIVAPFYDCANSANAAGPLALCADYKAPDGTPITDGLNVIDLTDGAVYTYAADPAADGGGADLSPAAAVGVEPDSAAIDPTTQIAIVPSEGGGFQNVLDLSAARFDKATRTFSAPNHPIVGQGLTGVAIEPAKHLGFWEEEHSADVGMVDVTQANAGAGRFVDAMMPGLPDGNAWANMGDPHGIAVTTGLADGRSVGFVVSEDRRWVARVDLQQMSDLGVAAGPGADPEISPAVTYLDATATIPAAK